MIDQNSRNREVSSVRTPITAAMTLLLASGLLAGLPAAPAGAVLAPLAGTSTPAPGTTAPRSSGTTAEAASDYSSIFSGDLAQYSGSGWTTCPAPIEWSVDTRGLSPEQASAQVENLGWAFAQWSGASGLSFVYAGVEDLRYDDAAFTLDPANGAEAELRHIYLDFVADGESARLSGSTVGLGSPTQVMASTKTIVAGDAVFRADHVSRATTTQARSLYLHELGHVLGLAHATARSNIMYPIVRARVSLGAGDVNGIHAMTKPCSD